jgi:hypothetical protein
MFDTSKFNALGPRRSAVLGGFLFAAVLALFPAPAEAQCTQWDVSGKWNVNITSGIRKGTVMNIDLQQSGNKITGGTEQFGATGKGTLSSGTLIGNKFGMVFEWKGMVDPEYGSAAIEAFVGTIEPDGRIAGVASIFDDRSGKATWVSDRPMKCLVRAPKPIKRTGKMPKSAPAPPTLKAPGIIASQAVFPTPYSPVGFAVLTWDAGPDHPYAEVWFKVNNGDEAFVVEQGKGSRQVTVERGKVYTYILTDAGKTLATVVVVGQ